MIKVTVSYSDERELQQVIRLLNPVARNIKRRNNSNSKYKKADITVSKFA